jgi:hypothetical protein
VLLERASASSMTMTARLPSSNSLISDMRASFLALKVLFNSIRVLSVRDSNRSFLLI